MQVVLTASIHSKVLHGGLVTACMRLTSVLSSSKQLATCLAALVAGLRLPGRVEELLRSCGAKLQKDAVQLTRLGARIDMKLKASRSEQHKALKALSFG